MMLTEGNEIFLLHSDNENFSTKTRPLLMKTSPEDPPKFQTEKIKERVSFFATFLFFKKLTFSLEYHHMNSK